jgi:hypothetical protein
MGIDRAVFFTVMARGWSTIAGAATILLIARFLTAAEQGYYYTFSSLVMIQVIFELGFSFVILQMAAHERSRITAFSSKGLDGDPIALARIASIFQTAQKWYSIAAILMGVVLLAVGARFFLTHGGGTDSIHWFFPWLITVVASSITFQIDPAVSFLEGCGQVADVARMRFLQAFLGSLLAWACLIFHHGLFAPGMLIAGQALVGSYFLLKVNGPLLRQLMRFKPGVHAVSWAKEIWPFQWRIAVSWASSYFIFQLFNPVLFAYQGPVVAGRMGMSLNIATALSTVALAWIATKAPVFGSMIAKNEIEQLDRLFKTTVIQSTAVLFTGVALTILGLAVLTRYSPHLVDRVLPLPSFSLLLVTILISHIVACQGYYLRAHKQEPFLWFWIWIALASGVSVLWSGKHYGAAGVTVAYFLCGGVLRLLAGTYVFFKKKKEWHAQPS